MLSVVIPTLNAGRSLGECLTALDGVEQIIVIDGGSIDDTVAVAERAGVRLIVAPEGRGAQLKVGAEAARGQWLLFLHADTTLGCGWREAIAAHAETDLRKAACFRFRLDDGSWQARTVERGVALRVRLLGLPYGDQGLLISRALYDEIGGYRALPFMEDVDLVRRIGRRRLRTLRSLAVTSADRWRQDGWALRSAKNLACLLLYWFGVSPARIKQLYD